MTGHDDAGAARPRNAIGRTAKLVMDTLAAEGFGTQPRAWEELWNLTITGMRHARSCLIVAGNGYLRWDYEPDSGPETSPAGIATMIMRLLGATDPGERPPDDGMYRAFLVKGAAGRMLEDQGLKVELLSYQDLESFDVVAEIQVINPGSPRARQGPGHRQRGHRVGVPCPPGVRQRRRRHRGRDRPHPPPGPASPNARLSPAPPRPPPGPPRPGGPRAAETGGLGPFSADAAENGPRPPAQGAAAAV